jgi:signal transduction histidine kinase
MTMSKKSFEKPELSVEDLSRALYESNQKLMSTIKERDEIYANISHDLRSPITAIRSSVEYLRSLDNPSREEIDSSLKLINDRSIVLEKMIGDIFTLTKMDSASYNLNLEDVPIAPFLEEIFFSYEEDPKYAKRHMVLDIDSEYTDLVQIDTDNMKKVLDNIFNNAFNYSSDGDTITLSLQKNENENCFVISIEDTGIGIEEGNLDLIFNRSFRVSNARTPGSSQGAGLGLSICKSIIEKHGGSIWCSSPGLGKGSTFNIKIPYDKTE